jgi:hypothetical protein
MVDTKRCPNRAWVIGTIPQNGWVTQYPWKLNDATKKCHIEQMAVM